MELPKPQWGEIELDENGNLYFIFRYESGDEDDGWQEYIDATEMLKDMGYEFVESYTEHDCISGNIRRI